MTPVWTKWRESDKTIHTYAQVKAMGATPYGRSLDWVIPEGAHA